MERILVCSDIHRAMHLYENVLQLAGDIDRVIIAGDLARSSESFRKASGILPLVMVQGNCDRYLADDLPFHASFNIEGVRFFVTHGHLYPDLGLQPARLYSDAKKAGAQVVIFGHTHRQTSFIYEGIRFLNPGALKKNLYTGESSYMIVTVDGTDLKAEAFCECL